MGYKMKGFSGFGNSPAKVSDTDILNLQSKLNKQELDFKEPGWAKVAGKLHDPLGVMGGDKGGKGGGIDKGKMLDTVQKSQKENTNKDITTDILAG